MKKPQAQGEVAVKIQIDSLCHFVDKKLDDSTKQLCVKLPDYNTEPERLFWLKQVFMTLLSSKSNLEQLMTSRQDTQCSQYQESLQKLQSEIRHHIAIEQEMKIHFENLQESLAAVQSDNSRLTTQLQKLKRKDKPVFKKKPEQEVPLKSTRGRSTTMIRDKSRAKLKQSWEMTENVDFNNVNLMNKLTRRVKNYSKSKPVK